MARRPTRLSFLDAKIYVKQEFAEECDINNILKRHARSGQPLPFDALAYGDYSDVDEYQTAQNKLIQAQNYFDALSSEIRDRMGNDPGKLLAFMENPDNLDEAVKLGLVEITPDPAPVEPGAPIVPAPDPGPIPPNPSPVEGGE